MTTNKNLVEANKELNQANTLQKKARRKYCLFALLLIVLVSAVIGIVFLTKSWYFLWLFFFYSGLSYFIDRLLSYSFVLISLIKKELQQFLE